jgi:ORMDL family
VSLIGRFALGGVDMTAATASGSPERNTDWLDCRGTWFTNVLLAVVLRLLFAAVPGVSTEAAWTLTNLTYNIFAFVFFHWLQGTPFDDANQDAARALTLWEQIDGGEPYTPTRKFLLVFPVVLYVRWLY